MAHTVPAVAALALCWIAACVGAPAADPASYYYSYWCGGDLQYLDDSQCAKVFPSRAGRHGRCAAVHTEVSAADGYAPDTERFDAVRVWRDSALQAIPHIERVNLALVLVRRARNGSVFYKYLGNGREREPHETWSSSKVFAVAAAAGAIARQCRACGAALAAVTEGKHGITSLADLATIICSYDTTMGYTSNSLSKYFSTSANQQHLNDLIQVWLRQAGTGQSLGGSYGEPPPPDLPYAVASPRGREPRMSEALLAVPGEGTDDAAVPVCALAVNASAPYPANTLSALSAAEMVRRLALHRDVLPSNRFPNTTWADAKRVLYGADRSRFFEGERWGGMAADPAIFVQSGLNMATVERASNGTWRILSKLGAGYSSSRGRGEIISNAYACLPLAGGGGAEFALSARASVVGDTTLESAQALLQGVVASAVALVYNGTIA